LSIIPIKRALPLKVAIKSGVFNNFVCIKEANMRKKVSALSFILVITSLVCALQKDNSWIEFKSTEGQFSVLLPQQPTAEDKQVNDEKIGPHTTHIFIAKGNGGIYMVGWVDYSSKFNFNPQLELEHNRDNFVKGLKATILESTNITFSGYQGIEFKAETANMLFTSRVLIVGRRPYQLIAATRKGTDHSGDINGFLSSFKVTK
jgi:hypothetical protein